MNLEKLRYALGPILRRLLLTVGRGEVSRVDPAKRAQALQVKASPNQMLDQVEHLQQYGVTSVPLVGAEVAIVCVGSDRAQPLAVASEDRRHRPTDVQPGEVALYTDELQQVRLERGSVVRTRSGPTALDAETVVEPGKVSARAGRGQTDGLLELEAGKAQLAADELTGARAELDAQQLLLQANTIVVQGANGVPVLTIDTLTGTVTLQAGLASGAGRLVLTQASATLTATSVTVAEV